MLQFSTGTRQQLPPQLFEQMGHYRREVFINQLGWEGFVAQLKSGTS